MSSFGFGVLAVLPLKLGHPLALPVDAAVGSNQRKQIEALLNHRDVSGPELAGDLPGCRSARKKVAIAFDQLVNETH